MKFALHKTRLKTKLIKEQRRMSLKSKFHKTPVKITVQAEEDDSGCNKGTNNDNFDNNDDKEKKLTTQNSLTERSDSLRETKIISYNGL